MSDEEKQIVDVHCPAVKPGPEVGPQFDESRAVLKPWQPVEQHS